MKRSTLTTMRPPKPNPDHPDVPAIPPVIAMNHLDGDITNNDLSNMRLVSLSENRMPGRLRESFRKTFSELDGFRSEYRSRDSGYVGPAVVCHWDALQQVILESPVTVQWDQDGEDFIVYPGFHP